MVYRPMDQPTNAPYGEMLGCLLTTKNNKSATKSYAVMSPSNHHTARPVQCQKSIDEKRNKRILFQNQRAATQLQRPSRMAIHKGKEQSETRVEPSILIENELEEIGLSLITPAQASAKEVSRAQKKGFDWSSLQRKSPVVSVFDSFRRRLFATWKKNILSLKIPFQLPPPRRTVDVVCNRHNTIHRINRLLGSIALKDCVPSASTISMS